jgi:hypothetical protein
LTSPFCDPGKLLINSVDLKAGLNIDQCIAAIGPRYYPSATSPYTIPLVKAVRNHRTPVTSPRALRSWRSEGPLKLPGSFSCDDHAAISHRDEVFGDLHQ